VLSLAYHDAAAVTAPASAGRPADRNLRQLLRRAIAARRALADTEDALARLGSGRYGICEGCAAAIPAWLLVVAPEARYCLRCRPKALVHSEVPSNPLPRPPDRIGALTGEVRRKAPRDHGIGVAIATARS